MTLAKAREGEEEEEEEEEEYRQLQSVMRFTQVNRLISKGVCFFI